MPKHRPPPGPGHRGPRGPGHPPGSPHRHNGPREDHTTVFLRELYETERCDVARLIECAAEYEPSGEAATFLAKECTGLPADIALDKLSAHRREIAFLRRQARLDGVISGQIVALILPLPPYVLQDFATIAGAKILKADHHDLPPDFRGSKNLEICEDLYESRHAIKDADIVLFDAWMNGTVHVRRSVADLIETATLKTATPLLVHFRPHEDRKDVPLAKELLSRVEPV